MYLILDIRISKRQMLSQVEDRSYCRMLHNSALFNLSRWVITKRKQLLPERLVIGVENNSRINSFLLLVVRDSPPRARLFFLFLSYLLSTPQYAHVTDTHNTCSNNEKSPKFCPRWSMSLARCPRPAPTLHLYSPAKACPLSR